MKFNIVKLLLGVCLCLLPYRSAYAVSLTLEEVKLANEISVFLDQKPDGKDLILCRKTAENESVVLKGLASVILFKHFGIRYQKLFIQSWTVNQAVSKFKQDNKIKVSLENVGRLLSVIEPMLGKLKDERTRRLFLFYHFRHKNVCLIDKFNGELLLADFYRMSFLYDLLKTKYNIDKLVKLLDK